MIIVSCSTLRIGPYLFYIKELLLNSKQQKKLIGHFRGNDDLALWRGPAIITPIMHQIMRSRNMQIYSESDGVGIVNDSFILEALFLSWHWGYSLKTCRILMVQTMTAFLDLEHSWSFLGENLETNKHIRDKCNIVLLQLYTQVLRWTHVQRQKPLISSFTHLVWYHQLLIKLKVDKYL